MLAFLGILLLYGVVFLFAFSGMTLVVWVMARVLMLIFPFSIFEAMLLSTFFSSFAAYVLAKFSGITEEINEEVDRARQLNNHIRTVRLPSSELDTRSFDRDDYKYIPDERFYKSASDRTWENWLLKEIANDVYAEFQHKSNVLPNLNDAQTRELAIRLTEFSVEILKRKTARARKLTITKNQLMREVEKNGQRAYDDAIVKLAVSAHNMNMGYYYDTLIDVVHDKKWTQAATIEDEA